MSATVYRSSFVEPRDTTPRFGRKRSYPCVASYAPSSPPLTEKTLAQQLIEEDMNEDDELFARIADEVNATVWSTPGRVELPERPSSSSSNHSTTSTNSSSAFSFSSAETSESAASSIHNRSANPQQSRRERTKDPRVYVDLSKNDVTAYDSGKVGVLTGGVMLGGPKKGPCSSTTTASTPRPSHMRHLHTLGRPALVNKQLRTFRV